jgi:hypothetical protein
VINKGGRAYGAPASGTSFEDFRSLPEINLLAAFGLAQAAYEELRASRGTVVNISSVTSQRCCRIVSPTAPQKQLLIIYPFTGCGMGAKRHPRQWSATLVYSH